ncbi:MAG: hypothetical protein ACR2M3_18215 [Thermomicrobiales bacterium]
MAIVDFAGGEAVQVIQQTDSIPRYRIFIVNGVFISGGVGEDGRVRPPHLFTSLAESLAAETGWRASALWPYGSKRIFGIPAFLALTRRTTSQYAAFLTESIRADVARYPLHESESVALIAYSGAVPIVQTAATLLRPAIPVGAFVFFGPAVLPAKAPHDWAGDATIGCILGEQDWVQGVYPRLPRPWHGTLHPTTHARLRAALPSTTTYRTIPCDHWPGYFSPAMWPLLVRAIADLVQPATVPR